MKDAIQYIFLFMVFTTVINFGVFLAARVHTKNSAFNQLIFYWASLFATYAAAAFSTTETAIAFAYFLQFIPAFLKTKVLRDSRGIRSNWNHFLAYQAVGMAISACMLLYTDLGFTISLLPVTLATTLPYYEPAWNSLVSHRKEANWIEKGMSLVLVTSVINHFNYAIFRLDESSAWWGWGISVAQYQCISIFLPLLLNQKRENKEIQNLKSALAKLSGKDAKVHTHSDDLYHQLEVAIAQKELYSNQLQATNLSLEEEREMNEMLIRTVSHDLANPLTVISAYIEILHAGKSQDTEKIWVRLKANTQSAMDMIGRIRNAIVNRTQSNLIKLNAVSVDSTIKRTLENFEDRLKEKNISLHYDNHIVGNDIVKADENALCEHVFANVVSNAIKFSYEGSRIEIRVSQNSQAIQVEVRDFGTGIQVSRLEKKILSSTQGTNGEMGTGFGLMVMGYFLRKFEGSIDMKSQTQGSDQGTSVLISLKPATNSSPVMADANIYS